MKNPIKSSLSTQYAVLFSTLLLAANIVLGMLLLRQSSNVVQSLIRKNMLNLSTTAAELVDGDLIGAFTETDVGSPDYNEILHELAAFQNNPDIEYIYAVRQVGEDAFIFTVDPDPVDPGLFGEEVLVTPALRLAGQGRAAVDNTPAEDRWGNFYSSFSPVFDSRGNVAGIIGIDFNSAWYNEQIWKNTLFIVLITTLFTLLGMSALFLINRRMRRRFAELNTELATLSGNVDVLMKEMLSSARYRNRAAESARSRSWAQYRLRNPEESENDDEIRILSNKIHSMRKEMEQYLDIMYTLANTDALTGIGNTTAYQERQGEIEARIQNGTARFSLVIFDINDLKQINDQYGHTYGDRIIRDAASFIQHDFGAKNTFRIGGDEFIAIVGPTTEEMLAQRLADLDEKIAAYRLTIGKQEEKLSLSRGFSSFIAGQDHSFREVFVRADQEMYQCKEAYHRKSRQRIPVSASAVPSRASMSTVREASHMRGRASKRPS